jgi:dihydroorotase
VYDLLIRDATIVTSEGRQVADVAVQDGRIRYVGPRPPRSRARREISAIGKFLMPGVIDTAVGFDTSTPDAWLAETAAAVTGGVTTVLALPGANTRGPGGAAAAIEALAGKSWASFGLWGAATTNDANALATATEAGVFVGALASVGSLADDAVTLAALPALLALPGTLGLKLDISDADHATVRAVFECLRSGERPTHLLHVSTALELDLIDPLRGELAVTAGVTPHHLFLSTEEIGTEAVAHPPIRPEHDRRTLWTAVKRGRLDCVASDHHSDRAAGLPGSELLFPLLLSAVKYGRLSLELLVSLCAEAPARVFGLPSKGRIERGADADLVLFSEGEISRVKRGTLHTPTGWSPYIDRESAPKPELVVVAGEIVAQRGELVGKGPTGTHVGSVA